MQLDFEPTLVVYHQNCPDGFGAAWACHQKWGDRVAYLPADHVNPPDVEHFRGQKILMLDVALKEAWMPTTLQPGEGCFLEG